MHRKFIHGLLSLEKIPGDFEIETGKFTLQKLPIVSGILDDTQERGFPTLHCALQSAFLSVLSGLLNVLLYLKRIACMYFFILIPMENMDFHQVMVHPV